MGRKNAKRCERITSVSFSDLSKDRSLRFSVETQIGAPVFRKYDVIIATSQSRGEFLSLSLMET